MQYRVTKTNETNAGEYTLYSAQFADKGEMVQLRVINDDGEVFTLEHPEEYSLTPTRA